MIRHLLHHWVLIALGVVLIFAPGFFAWPLVVTFLVSFIGGGLVGYNVGAVVHKWTAYRQ